MTDDEGSIMLLVLCYAAVIAILVGLSATGASLMRDRQALETVADGAATAGAQGINEPAVYAGAAGPYLPLDPAVATGFALRYVAAADRAGAGARLTRLGCDGTTVSVTVARTEALPLAGLWRALTSGAVSGQVTLSASALARSPLLG